MVGSYEYPRPPIAPVIGPVAAMPGRLLQVLGLGLRSITSSTSVLDDTPPATKIFVPKNENVSHLLQNSKTAFQFFTHYIYIN
jgi:hypothetical protein